MVSAPLFATIVSTNGFWSLCEFGEQESRAWTVKLNVPKLVGVPASTPFSPRDIPAGNAPAIRCQLTGAIPPVAVNVNP